MTAADGDGSGGRVRVGREAEVEVAEGTAERAFNVAGGAEFEADGVESGGINEPDPDPDPNGVDGGGGDESMTDEEDGKNDAF